MDIEYRGVDDWVDGERVDRLHIVLGCRVVGCAQRLGLRDQCLRMGPAAVVEGDHAAVIGCVLVGADPKHAAQRASHQGQESARRAVQVGGAGDRRVRSVVAVVPPVSRLDPAVNR